MQIDYDRKGERILIDIAIDVTADNEAIPELLQKIVELMKPKTPFQKLVEGEAER